MKRMMPVTDHPADVSQAAPPWRGFHHVALVARDLDATISFYRDVLGMEVVFIAPAGELHGRHGAVRPGGESDRTGLHFFEYLQAPCSVRMTGHYKQRSSTPERPSFRTSRSRCRTKLAG